MTVMLYTELKDMHKIFGTILGFVIAFRTNNGTSSLPPTHPPTHLLELTQRSVFSATHPPHPTAYQSYYEGRRLIGELSNAIREVVLEVGKPPTHPPNPSIRSSIHPPTQPKPNHPLNPPPHPPTGLHLPPQRPPRTTHGKYVKPTHPPNPTHPPILLPTDAQAAISTTLTGLPATAPPAPVIRSEPLHPNLPEDKKLLLLQVRPPTNPPTHSSTHLSIHLSTYPPTHPPTHPLKQEEKYLKRTAREVRRLCMLIFAFIRQDVRESKVRPTHPPTYPLEEVTYSPTQTNKQATHPPTYLLQNSAVSFPVRSWNQSLSPPRISTWTRVVLVCGTYSPRTS